MDKKDITNKLNNVVFQLDGMSVPGHENRKRVVIAVEMLVQLANEINEKVADEEVSVNETAEAQ